MAGLCNAVVLDGKSNVCLIDFVDYQDKLFVMKTIVFPKLIHLSIRALLGM